MDSKVEFREGLLHSVPIALGYFPVSFTFGLMAAGAGMSPVAASLISLTNFTSAGQFAGVNIIISNGGYIQTALTVFIINLRYMLMSLSLSQKLDDFSAVDRLMTGFGITDEVFAVSSIEKDKVNFPYMKGLILLPYFSWFTGTLSGALISNLLPLRLKDAMGIALYGMFLAIIIPVAKKSKKVLAVLLISVLISCTFYYVDFLKSVPIGWAIIVSTVAASLFGAFMYSEENYDE